MSLTQSNPTSKLTHKVALIVYQWAFPYTSELTDPGELPPVILSTDSDKPTGMHYIQFSRTKGPGGTMNIDIMGTPEDFPSQIGAWVAFYTTSKGGKFKAIEDITTNGVLKFVGQIYGINGQYMADGDGILRRTLKVSIREWSHLLHTPVRFHPQTPDANLSTSAQFATLQNSMEKSYKDLLEKLGTGVFDAFNFPYLAMAICGYVNDKTDTFVKDVSAEDLKRFSKTISHLPKLPKKLIEHVWGDAAGNDFADFIDILSGIQIYNSPTKDGTVPYDIEVTENTNRPIGRIDMQSLIRGTSLYEAISTRAAGNGTCEVYSDILYRTDDGGDSFRPTPTLVIRDLPFSLASNLSSKNQDKHSYKWTTYDDLPRTTIPAENIQSVSFNQNIENTSNLIILNIDNTVWNKATTAPAQAYYGTTVLPNSQLRFGGIMRNIAINDCFFITENKFKLPNLGLESPLGSTIKSETKTTTKAKEITIEGKQEWWQAASDRLIEYYSSDYMFFNVSLTIYDNDFLLSVGNNVEFQLNPNGGGVKFVGHITAIESRYQIVEGGYVTNQTVVSLSRVCGELQGKLSVLPTTILNNIYTANELDLYAADFAHPPYFATRGSSFSVSLPSAPANPDIVTENHQVNKDYHITAIEAALTSAQAEKSSIESFGGDTLFISDKVDALKSQLKTITGGLF